MSGFLGVLALAAAAGGRKPPRRSLGQERPHAALGDRRSAPCRRLEGTGFPYVELAPGAPRIGDWVLAVGNPFGLGGTVTAGIVWARGRDIGADPYDDFLQIDAPVNRGNSGGPAFNLKG